MSFPVLNLIFTGNRLKASINLNLYQEIVEKKLYNVTIISKKDDKPNGYIYSTILLSKYSYNKIFYQNFDCGPTDVILTVDGATLNLNTIPDFNEEIVYEVTFFG